MLHPFISCLQKQTLALWKGLRQAVCSGVLKQLLTAIAGAAGL